MSDKTQLEINGRRVGLPLTESQAVLILRWLDSDGVAAALAGILPPTGTYTSDEVEQG